MRVSDLARVLDQVRQLYLSAGTAAPAADLKALIDVLGRRGDMDVEAFVADAARRLSEPRKQSRPSPKAKSPAVLPNTAAIGGYVARLAAAGTQQAAFNAVFDAIKADKALRLAELTEIAHQYSGGVLKYKSVAAAQSEIAKAFVRQARFANKLL